MIGIIKVLDNKTAEDIACLLVKQGYKVWIEDCLFDDYLNVCYEEQEEN